MLNLKISGSVRAVFRFLLHKGIVLFRHRPVIECCTREILVDCSENPTENINKLELHLSGRWLSGTPIIRTLGIWNSDYPDAGYLKLRLSGRWLSETPIIRTLVI